MRKLLLGIITIVLLISMFNGVTTTKTATLAKTKEVGAPKTASEKKPIMGDVDQSGQVDAQDAVQILKYVAHNIELSEDALKLANTDGIGNVDAQDAVMILKYVAHNITEFPGKLDLIDFEALDAAKNDAAKYKEADYSVASYKKLKDALAMPETTQKEIDSKTKAIRNAIAQLTTDTSKLSAAKIESAKYAEADYSVASYSVLKNALAMPEKTQREIDAKTKAITDAIAQLKIDTSALNVAKNDAAKYKEENYSKVSYKVLKDALAMPETTQKQIDKKAKAIRDAIAQLKTDALALNVAKKEATKYKETDYSVATYKALKDALAMPEKTQIQIDAKTKAITSAIAQLNTDTSKLSVAKIEAAKYAEEDYSVASYKKLKDALAMPEDTQIEIDSKAKAITDAIAQLTTDVSALTVAKNDAAKYKEEDYSKASYKVLKDALSMPEKTQKQIDAKAKAITSAIAQLKTDASALNEAKKEAAKYVETDYSVASYKELKDALAMPEKTQKEIDSKEKAITSAIAQLTTDDTKLEDAETEASEYAKADYSVESYKALEDALAMPATTQKQINDKTAAILTAINGLEKKLAHVNVTTEYKTEVRYKQFEIATITSGNKEEKISIDNLKFNVIYIDELGNETNDQNAIREFITISPEPKNDGIILINFIGKKVGTYTINVSVGNIPGSEEIKFSVSENTELNYAELSGNIPETIKANQILSELEINFYHKYTYTDKLPIENVMSDDLTVQVNGLTVTLLDETKTKIKEVKDNETIVVKNAEVKFITIEFTEVGNPTLKIKFGEQTLLNRTFTVQAEAIKSVKLYDELFETEGVSPKEINTINLYTSNTGNITDVINVETYYEEDEDDDGNAIQVEYTDIYTLIPIYLVDAEGNREKINAGNIVNEIQEGKIKIGYYVNDVEQATKIMPKYFYIDENGDIQETTSLDIDYIGIAISNKKKAEELNLGKIKFTYNNRESKFSIHVQ